MELPASVKGEGPRMATLVEIGRILEKAQGEGQDEGDAQEKSRRERHDEVGPVVQRGAQAGARP